MGNELWLADSLKYIDFNYEIYISEAFGIMWWSKGGITLEHLNTLSLKDYETISKEALKVQNRTTETQDE